MRRKRAAIVLGMSCILMASAVLQGCQQNPKSGKVEIELVQYKPEAVDIFEQLEKEFNETHDDIHLKISSPNDATTILKYLKHVLSEKMLRILSESEEISIIRILLIQEYWLTFQIMKDLVK